MDRLISEKALLDKIDEWKGFDTVTIRLSTLRNIVKAIPSADKWISVSERLPKDDGLYLVYTEEQPFVCPFEDGEFFIDEVLAWMPLPSPYQPQERSDKG